MKEYKRLTQEERDRISVGLAMGQSFLKIAKDLGRHRSTIMREVYKGGCNRWTYLPSRGQNRARRKASGRRLGKRKLSKSKELWHRVEELLRQKWSPEEIANRLEKDYPNGMNTTISHEAIYQYVYVLPKGTLKKELLACMRHKHKRRYKHRMFFNRSKPLENMVSIEERPSDIETRATIGHWEGDLMIGKYGKSAMGTLVERKTKFTVLVKLDSKNAKEVRERFAEALGSLPALTVQSLTYDQGREMAQHQGLAKDLKIKVYFAHKASPWERGTNENTNGLLRQYFPKGTDFTKITDEEMKRVQDELNGRPRRCLNWDKPNEVFPSHVALNP